MISNPSAGISRIRFKELAGCLSARSCMAGHPHEMLALLTRCPRDCKTRHVQAGHSAIDWREEMGDVLVCFCESVARQVWLTEQPG
ncbi:hypothetical protein LAB1_08650 [Roseibium sp. LAB1]